MNINEFRTKEQLEQFEIFIDIHNTQGCEVEAQIIHCYFRSNSGVC